MVGKDKQWTKGSFQIVEDKMYSSCLLGGSLPIPVRENELKCMRRHYEDGGVVAPRGTLACPFQ